METIRKWKRSVFFVLVAILLSIPLVVMATGQKESKKKTIGYAANFAFFNDATTDWANAIVETAGARGVAVITLDAKGDVQKQLADVEDLISRGVDGLVIWPNDSKAIVPAVEAANKANIPVVVIDRGSDAGKFVSLVAGSDIAGSKAMAAFIANRLKGPGTVLELTGAPGSQVVANRSQGFSEGIKINPNLKLVTQPTDWTTESGLKVAENVMQSHPDDLLAIWAHSDEMAIGALQAVKGAGKLGKIQVFGYGAFAPMAELIKKGEVDAAVGFPSWPMGVAAANALLDTMEGKQVQKTILIDEPIVTKDAIETWKRGR